MGDGVRLNRAAYARLVEEDVEWLMKQPRSLEREHIAIILRWSTDAIYGPEDRDSKREVPR